MNQLSLALPMRSRGEERVAELLRYVHNMNIVDEVIEGKDIAVSIDLSVEESYKLCLNTSHEKLSIHPFALGQLCVRLRIPHQYVRNLLPTNWGVLLAANNLSELLINRVPDKKFLCRSVQGELRGFLSNAYKRFDSHVMLEEFSANMNLIKAVPYDALYSDITIALMSSLPDVWKIGDSTVHIGAALKNSEFGAARAEVVFFISVNGCSMFSQRGLRKHHLGRRLTLDSARNETIKQADNETLTQLIRENVQRYLSEDNLIAVRTELELSDQKELHPEDVDKRLSNLYLEDAEVSQITEAFKTNSTLPSKPTAYRLSTAIAWVASQTKDIDRQMELMHIAGCSLLKE